MKKIFTLSFLFLTLSHGFAQTAIYDITMPSTIGLTQTSGDMCSAPFNVEEAHQTTASNMWGATWESDFCGVVNSITVELMFTVSDGSTPHPSSLNGVFSNNVDPGAMVNCASGTTLYWVIDPANYITSGTNTLLFDFSTSGNVHQLDNLPYAGDPYMRITVDYTPTTPPVASINTFKDVTCFEGGDGQINIDVTGGSNPYTFDWDNDGTGDFDDPEDLTGLTAGTYTVIVKDDNGCTDTISQTISEPGAVDVTVNQNGAMLSAGAVGVSYQWLDCSDYSVITGETSQSFTATSDGMYAVEITDGACIDTSACITITGVGISETDQIVFSLYPNPVKDEVQLTIKGGDNINIAIFDINGKAVYVQSNVNASVLTIDMSQFENGVYFVQLKSSQNTLTKRLIKT